MSATKTITAEDTSSLSEYIPKNKFPDLPECPVSSSQFDYQFKQRRSNGFAKAFVKVSARNFLLHIPTYIECLTAKRGA